VGCPGCFYPDEDGPLPASRRNDFAWYIPVTLEKSDTYYRMWGGKAGLTGNPNAEDPGTYYSFFPPIGSNAWLTEQFSLLPEWGNTMENLDEVTIPAGTTVFIGPASRQTGGQGFYSGGGFQVWVPMR
jgi:hypothetical protein